MVLSHLPLCFIFLHIFSYQKNSFRLMLKIGPLLFSSIAFSAPVLFQGYLSLPGDSILYCSQGVTRPLCNGTSACLSLMDSPSATHFQFPFTIFMLHYTGSSFIWRLTITSLSYKTFPADKPPAYQRTFYY